MIEGGIRTADRAPEKVYLGCRTVRRPFAGVACVVKPVLPILDMLYSTRLVLEGLAGKYGKVPQLWPPSVVAQLRQRNTLLEQRIQRVICSLSNASYFTLGLALHQACSLSSLKR